MISDQRQEHLRHAIAKTLMVCAAMVSMRRGQQLASIAADPKLLERAVTLILNHMVRELMSFEVLTNKHFRRLLNDLATLGREV